MTPGWALVLLPALVGGFTWCIWRTSRRASTFPCPECRMSVAVDAIKPSGVECPHCGWWVEEISQ